MDRSAERQLCDLMGYDRAVLFPRARDALAAWHYITNDKIKIPSNCCSALLPFASELVPVDHKTGLAPVPVQLYGYRQRDFKWQQIEIDPLMTGLFGRPIAECSVVSFGYAKTIDIGGGGAILTSDKALAIGLADRGFFPRVLRAPLEWALENIHNMIMEKKKQYEEIENEYSDCVERLPGRPIIPWRFVAKLKSEYANVLTGAKARGYKVSKNYPPLPGVTDPGAIEWGEKVINIWK